MVKEIHIQFINRIQKTITGNGFKDFSVGIISLLTYPIALIVGIVLMLCFSMFSFFQKLFSIEEETEKIQKQEAVEQWVLLTNQNNLKIFQKYKGEIRFGPSYLNLKSEPSIELLKDKIFGDWYFCLESGILLQEWNSLDKPSTDLIFVDFSTLKINTLQKNIPSVFWNIVKTKNQELELICDTGKEIIKYQVEYSKV